MTFSLLGADFSVAMFVSRGFYRRRTLQGRHISIKTWAVEYLV